MTTADVALIDAADLAARIGMTRETVYRHARNGGIPSVKFGRSYRFDYDAVIEARTTRNETSWKQSSRSRARRRK